MFLFCSSNDSLSEGEKGTLTRKQTSIPVKPRKNIRINGKLSFLHHIKRSKLHLIKPQEENTRPLCTYSKYEGTSG
jgi:hypothetical protein